MRVYLHFIRKEFLHILRDGRTMLILLVMPMVMVLLFGFAITTEVRNSRVAFYDPTHSFQFARTLRQIDASRYFDVVLELSRETEANAVFEDGRATLVLIFDGEDNIQVLADGSEPNQASLRVAYLQQILMQSSPILALHTTLLYNPNQESGYNFVPGVIGMMLLLICAMMSSVAIVREREVGTMELLLASPLPPAVIVLGKAVPYFCLSAVNFATILLLSVFVMKIPIAGSVLCLAGVAVLYILVALSLGLLISTLVDSQLSAMVISAVVLMLPTILLSGLMFPIESMPCWLQWLSSIVPARYFIDAVRKLMIQGVEPSCVRSEVVVLSAMLVVLAGAAIRKFKLRLQ